MKIKTIYFINVLFSVLNLISDLPCITFLEAYDRKELNEMSPFRLTCIVNSSTSTNMSIKNMDSGKVMRTGILTDTLAYTQTSAKCYQTAEYICIATNIAGSIESSPVKILVNCSILCHALFCYDFDPKI